MKNVSENQDRNLNKEVYTELFRKSAALKEKNSIVQEKLNTLKKMSDEFLKSKIKSQPEKDQNFM